MADKILVSVAWPYANADIHVGNITGSHLPADIFARYHRLRGDEVLMVSGTDSHGTPVSVRADAEKTTPLVVYEKYHRRFIDLFVKLGITFDLFTSTHTENHFKVSQDMFTALLTNGYLYREKQQLLYSETEKRFLPDRYVEGECYICGYPDARGDQCDNCGNLLDAEKLINPRSKIDGSRPVLRETEHYFFDLGKLAPKIQEYLSGKPFWRTNVISFARNMAADLHGRPITRDLDWGIPVPVEGWEAKKLYVWFEAVIGYLSASIEWAKNNGTPEAWKKWWYAPEALTYYFIGKDNIPFHTVIWPAQLLGASKLYVSPDDEALNLPYDVPANEFMNMEGRKISGSRNWGVWGLDFLERYDPDPLRYYLTAQMPETKDTDWAWSDFWRRNNDELVATWGNLANRILSFTVKNFDGTIPQPGEFDQSDRDLLEKFTKIPNRIGAFEQIDNRIQNCLFREALADIMGFARDVNKYVDEKAPWFSIKTDRARTATTLYVALRAIDSLKVLFAPFLPFSSQRLHAMLGYDGDLFGRQIVKEYTEETRTHLGLTYDASSITVHWQPSQLPAGQKLGAVAPLFKKLDETCRAAAICCTLNGQSTDCPFSFCSCFEQRTQP
jgi:methionyl-tRNA synthetase